MKDMVFVTKNAEETQKIAQDFARRFLVSLVQGDSLSRIIALRGELGSGKTTFVQGLAKGLGIAGRIMSPTFTIVRSHRIRSHELGIKYFYHIDLYRVEGKDQVKNLGLEEIINSSDTIVAIEWAEKITDLLPKKRWDIAFEYVLESERRLTLNKLGFD